MFTAAATVRSTGIAQRTRDTPSSLTAAYMKSVNMTSVVSKEYRSCH